jgi:H+/Cl- antiporter ClcA
MKSILSYLIILLCLIAVGLLFVNSNLLLEEFSQYKYQINCILIGGIGGILYNLRAIYINKCVYKNWDKEWEIWYYIRPVTSMISGGVSLIIIKAGLLVMESTFTQDASYYGIYALAFIAGLNVDRFLSKIEDLAKAAWSIDKSRSSQNSDKSITKPNE